MQYDLNMTDDLLSTTRAVRKRLDLEKPVPREIIEECITLSQQAPTGTNSQGWRWIVVEDAAKRARLAEIYRLASKDYLAAQGEVAKSLVRIYKALGGGWQIRLNDLGADPVDQELLSQVVHPEDGTVKNPVEMVTMELP